MRIIVCGGRSFSNVAYVHTMLWNLHAQTPITELMQGGATGVDAMARTWAKAAGIKRYVCHAEWATHGKAAGPKRNARMLEWKPDAVVAFPGGRGTANMVAQARTAGVRVIEFT